MVPVSIRSLSYRESEILYNRLLIAVIMLWTLEFMELLMVLFSHTMIREILFSELYGRLLISSPYDHKQTLIIRL